MCLLKDVRGLGFCDLECFRALLVKQGWRILSNPQSLLARLLKGKYFSSTTFLNAKQGSRASWVSRVFYREEFCLRKVSIANWEMVNQFYVTKIVGFQLFFLISLELKRLMIIHLLWSLIWSILSQKLGRYLCFNQIFMKKALLILCLYLLDSLLIVKTNMFGTIITKDAILLNQNIV